MAMQVPQYRRDTEVVRARNPVPVKAPKTYVGDLAQGMGDVGDMFAEWQDEIDTAAAKKADAFVTERLNTILYDPENGYLSAQGQNAIDRLPSFNEEIDGLLQEATKELSPTARRKVSDTLQARREQVTGQAMRHASTQRRHYLNEAAEARVASTVSNAIYDPSAIKTSIGILSSEISGMAEREGWAPEVRDQKLREAETAIHLGVIDRMKNVDPQAAADYLAANRDRMTGEAVAKVEPALVTAAKERRGREIGAAVFSGGPAASGPVDIRTPTALTSLDGSQSHMVRPEAGERMAELLRGPAAQMQQLFGGPLVINDAIAKDGTSREHNTPGSRHFHGDALDISTKGMSNEEKRRLVEAAMAAGFTGFGFGVNILHVDMGNRRHWAYGNSTFAGRPVDEWGQVVRAGARSNRAVTPPAERQAQPGSVAELLEHDDPIERDAALREYDLRMRVSEREEAEMREAAADAAFQAIETGGSVDDLPLAQKEAIGLAGVNSLRIYEDRLKAKDPIETDSETYLNLNRMIADEPEAFADLPLVEYRDRLDDTDFKYMVRQQAAIRDGERKGVDVPAPSTLMSTAKWAIEAAGIDSTPKPGSREAERLAKMQSGLVRWATANPELANDPEALDLQINRMLTPIVLNPPGMWNEWEGAAFEIDIEGDPLDPNDDLTPEKLLESDLSINGKLIKRELIEEFVEGFNDRFGRPPSVREVLDGLVGSGLF